VLRRFDGKQACNDDLDAAVDAFFAGTLDARVASLDDDEEVDRTRATRDGARVDRAGRREENADDAMVISDGEGTMDEDSDDYWDDDGSSPIDLMGEDDDDPNPWNTEARREALFADARSRARMETRERLGFGGAGASAFQARDGGDIDLPDGIDREEARMLEAAMLGVAYIPPDNATASRIADYGPSAPAPASVLNARSITTETDRAYEESLRADQEKEAQRRAEKIAKEMIEAEKAQAEAREKAEREAEEAARAKIAADAAEALPEEPNIGDDDVVNIAFRLPDGSRVMRRFLSSHSARALFLFIDGYEKLHAGSSRLAVEPGTYRLVAQHPRRVIESDDAGTIAEAGITHKQEALMIDLLG